jgi:hypothetical protein
MNLQTDIDRLRRWYCIALTNLPVSICWWAQPGGACVSLHWTGTTRENPKSSKTIYKKTIENSVAEPEPQGTTWFLLLKKVEFCTKCANEKESEPHHFCFPGAPDPEPQQKLHNFCCGSGSGAPGKQKWCNTASKECLILDSFILYTVHCDGQVTS